MRDAHECASNLRRLLSRHRPIAFGLQACKHAQQDVIPSHEMVVERRADLRGHQTEPCDADHAVNEEKLLGEYRFLGQVGSSSNKPKTVTGTRYAEVAIQPATGESPRLIPQNGQSRTQLQS
jgi:hypothetical protein